MADAPFLRLARKTFENFLWKEERPFSRFEAWLDLVQSSAYEPQKRLIAGELIDVPRGGIVASERFLSNRWKWSRTKVRAFLDLLLKEGMIKPEKNHRQSVFLLCNFEKYNPQKNHPSDHGGTTGEPPGNQIEEGKESEKTTTPTPAGGRASPDDPPDELLTEEQAAAQARNAGVPEDFARYVWQAWAGRDGKDGTGVKVRFASYVKKRWNIEGKEWVSGSHNGKKNHDNNNGKRGPGRIGATHDPTGRTAAKYGGV